MAFWRSGKYTIDEDLAEFGIRVSMLPWFWVSGSRGTKPWAAQRFDEAGRRKRRARMRQDDSPSSS